MGPRDLTLYIVVYTDQDGPHALHKQAYLRQRDAEAEAERVGLEQYRVLEILFVQTVR